MSHEQVACLPLLQLAVLIKHSLGEFARRFRTESIMSWGVAGAEGSQAVMWITSDSVGVFSPPSPVLRLPSPACCRNAASSAPSTVHTSTQQDRKHELNSGVILHGVLRGTYVLLQISKGLQVKFPGIR